MTDFDIARDALARIEAEQLRSAQASAATISALRSEVDRLKKLLEPHLFVLGDATRKQFLGAPFLLQFPGSYESAFYASGVTPQQRPSLTVDKNFVLTSTMPRWRTSYPLALHWFGDIEWANSGGRTAAEIAKILPAFQGAREFADNEGKGLKIAGYYIPKRFGIHETDAEVLAQAAIDKPILDLLDICLLTLYPVYSELERARTFIRRNIAMGRRIMPGKKVYVLGASKFHSTVGVPLAGTFIPREWQRMFLEEISNPTTGADGYAPWTLAAEPKPTTEPWWLETQAWLQSIGR